MSDELGAALLQKTAVIDQFNLLNKIDTYFPDAGNCPRSAYPKHIEFFDAGSTKKERMFMAANRVGKTQAGAYETACHLTGRYPHWWKGKRFQKPTEGWASGTTGQTTRDIVQRELLGPVEAYGTGMIPAHLIDKIVPKRSGHSGAAEGVWVKHVAGGRSWCGFKSYEQGRKSFEGTAKDFIWNDEEPPEDCYIEMLYRTATTRGICYVTFTPLQGMSSVVKGFLEPENPESENYKWYVQAGWKDVPHIPEEEKAALLATTPPYQIKARTDGEPSLGEGAIYPIAESDVSVEPFKIPDNWQHLYALDVGWTRTAVIWGARNPATGIIYLYDEHYQGQGEPASHAHAIKARGPRIPGVIDPASSGSNQKDGSKLAQIYRDLGLTLTFADNDVIAGVTKVWQLLVSGELKVFTNCQSWFREFRKYHRDKKGIVKTNDHLMDSTRYVCMAPLDRWQLKNPPVRSMTPHAPPQGPRSWMA